MRNYVRKSKNGQTHQKRAGVKEAGNGVRGKRMDAMYAEPVWHWSDSVTLVALEAKLAHIRQTVPAPAPAV